MRVLLAPKARPGQSHNAPALRGRSIEAGFDDMAAKQFNLMTEWRLDAPIERVWPLLTSIEEWPLWWRAVSQVELLKAGDANGLGSIHRITWKTALPYQLTFDTRMTRIEPMSIRASLRRARRSRPLDLEAGRQGNPCSIRLKRRGHETLDEGIGADPAAGFCLESQCCDGLGRRRHPVQARGGLTNHA